LTQVFDLAISGQAMKSILISLSFFGVSFGAIAQTNERELSRSEANTIVRERVEANHERKREVFAKMDADFDFDGISNNLELAGDTDPLVSLDLDGNNLPVSRKKRSPGYAIRPPISGNAGHARTIIHEN